MSENTKTERQSIFNWRYSILAWLVSAAILLIIATGLVAKGVLPYSAIGYVSSIISFMAAFFAGCSLARGTHLNKITVISGAICLVILLLTIGYFISHGKLTSSGILSTASFTIAGSVTGALLCHSRKPGKRNTALASRRKKR